jgi:3-hydroxyisobutyrate dehydrogenase
MRVGFGGLGRMGRRMAANLAAAGHEVTVWNRSAGPAGEVAAATGARRAERPADLARGTEVAITMLADDAAARAVYLGADGLLVEMGTMSPDLVAELGEAARAAGKTYVDAPVSGATEAAAGAQLLIMAGAEETPRLAPLFDAMGRRTIWLGRPGAGAAMKLAVNMLIHGLNQTLAEALTLAEAAGIEAARAYEVIESSAAAAPMVHYRKPQYLDEANAPVSFTVDLARKDVALALDLARRHHVAMPQTEVTGRILGDALARGYAGRDMAAVLAFMREAEA